ncbi:MAG: radical SAM family heme chaperone HemW [Verrucomicrobiota bacterium]|nr:radical SAM family heme chaperone HemW [Verrucomicrobiota bacterium]
MSVPRPYGLYLHVPFCVRKCGYCAFFSEPYQEATAAAWLQRMEQDLRTLPVGFQPDTVFWGGGTPTVLETELLQRLLEALHAHVDLSRVTEWTVEANPGTLTEEKAGLLRQGGVNRLSIGAQSFCSATLHRLGRIHTNVQIREAVEWARSAGIHNISLDLIYGVPGVPLEEVQADVAAAQSLEPSHLSCYALEVEEGTPFAEAHRMGGLELVEDDQRRQYEWIRHTLGEAGWTHYEISNFARSGRECRHNLLYWMGGAYIGLGPSAHSHWNGARWGLTATLPVWSRAFEETLPPEAKACETLVMGLRRLQGWGREEFRSASGFDYDALRGPEIDALVHDGLLLRGPDRIRLAPNALFVSNAAFSELV